MTEDDEPVRDDPPKRVSSSPQDEKCTEGAGRQQEYEGHVAYWLGFRQFLWFYRARVKSSSCNILRREHTAWNGSHFVVNVALMDEAGASNDK